MQNKQNVFNKEYFEESKGLLNKRVYNCNNTALFFRVMTNTISNTIKPENALDIGCAKGYLVDMLNQSGIDAYGIDLSDYAISQASDTIKSKLYTLDIEKEKLPFADNYFDLITIIGVLEHLYSFEHVMEEIERVIKKNGYVFVIVPTPDRRSAKTDKTHINVQFRRCWVNLFKKYGLILINDSLRHNFNKVFLREFKNIMSEIPPTNILSKILIKIGAPGNLIRNRFVPYIHFFSLLRTDEILLFKKIDSQNSQYS